MMCIREGGSVMDIKKFKKEHSTFIAVGTTLLIVAAAAIVWKYIKKICNTMKEEE